MNEMDILAMNGMSEEGTFGWQWGDSTFNGWKSRAEASERRFKALTTGNGVVQPGDTGGRALRVQYLHDEIENVSFAMSHAKLMQLIPKGKAWSTTVEYTLNEYPGQGGDGFIDEAGSDNAFGVNYQDDNFLRQVELVKYMAEARQVGLVEQEVRNLADPMAIEKRNATKALLAKANIAAYFGNAGWNASSYNGIVAQMLSWVINNPQDVDIFVDMGGQPLDKQALEDIAIINLNKYGNGDLLVQSATGWGDSNKLLFPEARETEGTDSRRFGSFKNVFSGPNGDIRIAADPMLRIGNALRPDGPGSDGLPRATVAGNGVNGPDANSVSFASNPFAANAAVAVGTGLFCQNGNVNTDTGSLATAPTLPTGGTNTNRLAAGNYYYAVAPVYRGAEGPLYILGAGAQGQNLISGAPTAIAVTAGQIVKLDFDNTTPAITGLGSAYGRANVYYRIYRFGGPAAAAPVNVTDFKYLDSVGIPTSGNSRYYDNGFKIAGSDNAFLLTMTEDGQRCVEFLQLLPLMQRMGLPELPMASPLVLLWFCTLMLWRRRKNIWIRNIGRA